MDFAQWEDFVRQMDPLIRLVVRQTLCHHHRRPVRDELKELRQEVYFRLVNRQARGLAFLAGREPKELRAYVSAVARAVVVDAVLAQLGLDLGPLAISSGQRASLIAYATSDGPTLDLSDQFTDDAQTKVRGLISLALQAAESQIF